MGSIVINLISNDETTRKKSVALYHLFGIKTKVLSVEQFIDQLPVLTRNAEPDMFVFFERMSKDIKEVEHLSTIEGVENNPTSLFIEVPYFGFFDVITKVKDNSYSSYMLRKSVSHSLTAPNFREQGAIVDRVVAVFGPDIYARALFNFELEVDQSADKKIERVWRLGNYLVFLNWQEGLNEFCMVVGLVHSIEIDGENKL